jgi:hypothetical protein
MIDPRFGLPDLYEALADAEHHGDGEAVAALEAEIDLRAACARSATLWHGRVQEPLQMRGS